MLPIVAHCCPLLSIVSQCVWGEKLSAMSNCPQCQIVRGVKLSGVKLSTVSNCPGVKLPAVSNCLQCQIVRGVKLFCVKLSWCQIVLMSNYPPTWAVSNCPRCQIVLGPSFGRANVILCGLSYNSINPINQIKVQSRPCFNKATKEKNDSGQNFSRGENLFHLPSDPLLCCLFHLPRSVLAFIWRIPPFFLWTGSERGQYALFTFTAGVPLPILGAFFDKK